MEVTTVHQAGEHERFAPTAFDSQIGKVLQVPAGPDTSVGPENGVLIAAKVSPDGSSVELTFNIPNPRTGEGWYSEIQMYPPKGKSGEQQVSDYDNGVIVTDRSRLVVPADLIDACRAVEQAWSRYIGTDDTEGDDDAVTMGEAIARLRLNLERIASR